VLRQARADKAKKVVKERRRFRVASPANGLLGPPVPPKTSRTVFPSTVKTPDTDTPVLTDGINQVKLGGRVLTGTFKGYYLYDLTLEERATCPKTCEHWRTCYGNHMPFSTRLTN